MEGLALLDKIIRKINRDVAKRTRNTYLATEHEVGFYNGLYYLRGYLQKQKAKLDKTSK